MFIDFICNRHYLITTPIVHQQVNVKPIVIYLYVKYYSQYEEYWASSEAQSLKNHLPMQGDTDSIPQFRKVPRMMRTLSLCAPTTGLCSRAMHTDYWRPGPLGVCSRKGEAPGAALLQLRVAHSLLVEERVLHIQREASADKIKRKLLTHNNIGESWDNYAAVKK